MAQAQLNPAEFAATLKGIYKKFPPTGDYAALQAYLEPTKGPADTLAIPMPRPALAAIFNPAGHPVTPQPVSTPKKRKADGELPIRNKTACHAQAQQRRESSTYNTLDLQGTLRLLGKLQEISKT